MGSDTILSRVEAVIIKSLSPDEPKKVNAETRFVEDLNADSLDIVELLMAFENEFGIEIPDAEAQNIKTVQDVVHYIETISQKKE